MGLLKKIFILILMLLLLILQPLSAKSVHKIAASGDLETVEKMITQKPQLLASFDSQGRTPLHEAAYHGQLKVVAFLLDKGAEISLKSKENKRTALHFAAWKGHTKVTAVLLKRGADMEAKEVDGETPLQYAAASGSIETVKFLISRGAKINHVSGIETTPLTYAVERATVDMVKFLISKGADVKRQAKNGFNLLHRAAWDSKGDMITFLVKKGISPNSQTDFGRTPLQNAAMTGNVEAATVLIRAGAEVNTLGEEKWTSLYLAARGGYAKMVDLLLRAGAKVDFKQTRDGKTLLHLATINGYGRVVDSLLAAKVDPNVADDTGLYPLQYAARYGHLSIAKALKAGGAKQVPLQKNFGVSKLLQKDLSTGQAIVWYLGHSGWGVKTRNNLLIFDYYPGPNQPDHSLLANGRINPEEIKDLKVTVFVSHAHGDHYDKNIFDWRKEVKNITYVFGFEPEDKEGYVFIAPRKIKSMNSLKVATILSNDSGVGFFVEADGVRLFHSGDHANRKRDFSGPFKAEIDYLAERNLKPELLFAPISGCGFGDQVAVKKGVYYTVKRLKPVVVFPMHSLGGEHRYEEFARAAKEEGLSVPMSCAQNRGDYFVYSQGKVKNPYAAHHSKASHTDGSSCKKSKTKEKGKT